MRFNPNWLIAPAAMVAISPAYATEYLNAEQAAKSIFPEADKFSYAPVALSKEQMKEIQKRSGIMQRWSKQDVWRAEKNGKLIGYFITDNVIGKHEFITYGTGLSLDGHVRGIEIMTYKETRGDEVRQSSWRNIFKGKTLNDPFKLNKDIPNISGATLSCKNIMNGVKRLLVLQDMFLQKV